MEQKLINNWIYVVVIILALGLVLSVFRLTETGNQNPGLQSSGYATVTTAPDQAVLYITVETNANTALESQKANAAKANEVVTALKVAGLSDKDIETNYYNVMPQYYYPENKQPELYSYRTSNSFKITTKQLDKVGSFIDAASKAGANKVDSIEFSLSDEKLTQVKSEALAKASLNAKEKASTIANSLGVKLHEIKSVSESVGDISPYRYEMTAAKAMDSVSIAPTPIEAKDVKISATVSLSYSI